ncbi:MAG: cell division septal protein, partial [Singulisphaera sp.]|nr:cell division septal protein [Singulisphaera sp.]
MEHREAAGMASAEARPRDSDLDPDHVRWFARYRTPPIIHWLTPPRLVPILLAVAVAVSALVIVGTQALRSAVRWLEGRPPYRVGFREIVLVPPPPAWYRGGSVRFLDRVLANSPGRGEMLSVLDEDLGALAND